MSLILNSFAGGKSFGNSLGNCSGGFPSAGNACSNGLAFDAGCDVSLSHAASADPCGVGAGWLTGASATWAAAVSISYPSILVVSTTCGIDVTGIGGGGGGAGYGGIANAASSAGFAAAHLASCSCT